MSLQDAKMPRLINKIEEKAEEVRKGLEKKDEELEKIIKKSAKKD